MQFPYTPEPALRPLLISLQQSWSPIPKAFWDSDSKDDDYDDHPVIHTVNPVPTVPEHDIPVDFQSDDFIGASKPETYTPPVLRPSLSLADVSSQLPDRDDVLN